MLRRLTAAAFMLSIGPSVLASGCSSESSDGAGGGGNAGAGAQGGSAGQTASCDPSPQRCDPLGLDRPFRVSEHSAVYAQDRLEMIVFGGTNATPKQCEFPPPQYNGETWIFDDPCGKWTQVQGGGPSPRGRHNAAYGDGKVWLFGGRYRDSAAAGTAPYTLYDDLWAFDTSARTWSQVAVAGAPPPRVNAALVWDDKRHRLWLYGGNSATSGSTYTALGDLWSFDPMAGSWQQHAPAGELPAARLFHAGLYDAKRDRFVIYGGTDKFQVSGTIQYMRDIWALDLETVTWTRLTDGLATGPDGRFWAGLVHDTAADEYLLFGGHDDTTLGNRNDVWRFAPDGLAWTQVDLGDPLKTQPVDFCNFPPDFTEVKVALPERRSAHSMVYGTTCGRTLIFGGKTDCGAVDDVWGVKALTFEERSAATEGEVCHRWRPDPGACSNLCN
ncbi:MAG: kelch repeat-containing protein [Polyangiaceae bacterium]